MTERLPLSALPKPALAGMAAIDRYLHGVIDRNLLELVKLRASQMNGCAFCIDMHHKEARDAGESEQRLYGLSAWRESPYYSPRERAVLAWTEAVTTLGNQNPDDALWTEIREHLDPEAVANLTVAVIAINGWNRWNVAMRTAAGGYEPGMFG